MRGDRPGQARRRERKPDTPEKARWPEFKTCKYTTEAIVSDGIDKGEMRRVCMEPTCSVHHSEKQTPKADATFKAEQEKRRREEASANARGIRVPQIHTVASVGGRKAIGDGRAEQEHQGDSVAKMLIAFIRKANEGTIGKLIVEAVILLSARSQADAGKTLRTAAQVYGVNTDSVDLKVKQEFARRRRRGRPLSPRVVLKCGSAPKDHTVSTRPSA
jgi:ParB family chromosome partitioning protein